MNKESLSDEQKQLIQEIVNRKATIPENIMMGGVFIAGSGVVGFAMEAFQYLKSGVWPKWAMLSTMESILPNDFVLWLNSPESWRGLHTLVVGVLTADTSFVLFLAGMVIYWIGRMFDV